MAVRKSAATTTAAEAQLATYFAQCEPTIARLGKALRAKLRAQLPGLSEVVYVYENQQLLLISYSPSEHGYEGLCSLALYPDRVLLHFAQGAALANADPQKLLQGRGQSVRHLALKHVADFERPEIQALMEAALQLANLQPVPGATGPVIIKAEAQKKRASRTSRAAPA